MKIQTQWGPLEMERMTDDVIAGYGPGYSHDPKGQMFRFIVTDDAPMRSGVYGKAHAIREESLEDAMAHAEIVLCPEVDKDLRAELAALESDGEWGKIEDLLFSKDARICEDGSVRHTWGLRLV